MWRELEMAALVVQAVPAVIAVKYGRLGKATLYLSTLPFLWIIALDMVSGHLGLVPFVMLVVYPLPWLFLLRVMKRRRDQLDAAKNGNLSKAS